MESEKEEERIETCPTCGSHVPVYISSGGTGSFIPIFIEVIRDRLANLESSLKEKQSRISSLEAALSLSPENVERVARTCHRGIYIYFTSKRERVLMEAAAFIRAIRLIAGLEGTDNNQLRETP